MFVHAVLVKNIAREKAYIWKTIPFYMCYWLGILSSVYNFYMLKQPFNGVICFCLTGFISLCMFSFSPVPFLLGLILGASLMAPGVYAHFGLTGLLDTILAAVLMFCLSLYKRRTEKNFLMLLKRQKQSLEAHTFGNFTLMYEGKVVKFSRTKSLEMIAYLVCKNGSSVNTRELLSVLWGEKADSARYGASFRNLVVDIKKTLGELEIQNFFVAEYNNFRINPEAVKCDYYDCLSGDKKACKGFTGEFMNQYSWAEDTAAFLERRILSRV